VEHGPKPTFVVDISDVMDAKLEAILAFGSQLDGKTSLGDVYPGGDRPIREQVLALHAQYGGWIRCRYGEPYWTRETMAVADLRALAVASF
jgi:N-acetylglucosamine malate deacetylase 1